MTNVSAVISDLLTQRILILDGAMGTMVQRRKLEEEDFRGKRFQNSEILLKGNKARAKLLERYAGRRDECAAELCGPQHSPDSEAAQVFLFAIMGLFAMRTVPPSRHRCAEGAGTVGHRKNKVPVNTSR